MSLHSHKQIHESSAMYRIIELLQAFNFGQNDWREDDRGNSEELVREYQNDLEHKYDRQVEVIHQLSFPIEVWMDPWPVQCRRRILSPTED